MPVQKKDPRPVRSSPVLDWPGPELGTGPVLTLALTWLTCLCIMGIYGQRVPWWVKLGPLILSLIVVPLQSQPTCHCHIKISHFDIMHQSVFGINFLLHSVNLILNILHLHHTLLNHPCNLMIPIIGTLTHSFLLHTQDSPFPQILPTTDPASCIRLPSLLNSFVSVLPLSVYVRYRSP